jgi:transketolase
MRNHFANILHETMVKDDNVFLLYGDIGNRLFDQIKSDFPERIENAGVAEASMVGIAAGLSQAGYLPVCYTINSFLYLKALEQIKLDLAYPARKAVLVGTGGGLSYGSLGTSHHSIEDYAVLGSIPNLNLYSPADSVELELNLQDALANDGPSYLRIGKKGEREVTTKKSLLTQ